MTSVVAPNLKPKAENGCCSEISITSFIFFSRVLNVAKSCGRLLPPEKGKVFLPCHLPLNQAADVAVWMATLPLVIMLPLAD